MSLPAADTARVASEPVQRASEWRFVAALIAITLIVTSAPYVFAYATTPPDKQFMGIMLNVPDHIQYFSWMRDLSTSFQAADRLTPEPNDPAYFNLLWWGLGHVGALLGLDYAAVFNLLRVLAIAVSLGSVYAFLQIVVRDLAQRKLTFVLIAFGGGVGVIWIVAKYLFKLSNDDQLFSFDTFTPEPNTFLQLLGYPHFAMALGLLVATFGLVLIALRARQLRYAIAAGIVALILGLQHAYDLVTLYAVLGSFGLLMWLRDRRFPRFLFTCGVIVVGVSMPPAAYSFLLVKANPIWREVFAQFDLAGAFTPEPWHLPVLLGVPFLLAFVAFRPRMLQDRSDTEMFIGAWFVSHFVLVYLPIDFQIHLLLGWQVPIAILAGMALATRLGPALARRSRIGRRAIVAGLIALSVVTNVYLYAWRFVDLGRHESPYYLSRDEVAALDWLADHTTSRDVVLAVLDLGQYIPMWSEARAFLAHWTGTVSFHNKIGLVNTVLSANSTDTERLAILDEHNVTYVITSPVGPRATEHQQLGEQFAGVVPYLAPVLSKGPITVYRVNLPQR